MSIFAAALRKSCLLLMLSAPLCLVAQPALAQDDAEALRETPLVPCQQEEPVGAESEECLREEAYWSAQWAMQSSAARALAAVNARFAAGDSVLADVARDLQEARDAATATEAELLAALSLANGTSGSEGLEELRARQASERERIAMLEQQIAADFPDFADLVNPQPLTVAQTQALLRDDEALILILPGDTGTFSFIVTKDSIDWHRSDMNRRELAETVDRIRLSMGVDGVLTASRALPGSAYAFDRQASHRLYRELLAPHAERMESLSHAYFVASGAFTALPPGVLVTAPPEGDNFDPDAMRSTRWLLREMAITVLPAPSSLQSLLRRPPSEAQDTFLGIGNACTGWGIVGASQPPAEVCGAPPAGMDPSRLSASNGSSDGGTTDRGAIARGEFLRNTQRAGNVAVLDPGDLRSGMTYLPGTRTELLSLAQALNADPEADLLLAREATESRVRSLGSAMGEKRLLVFATHGLVATDGIANLDEPGLVLTPPLAGSVADDGFLSASEIAADLTLDADFVILSACNTASPSKRGAESLSGLARSFFYAGARSLLVSHWPVDDTVASQITVGTVASFNAAPAEGRASALRQALLPLMDAAETSDPYFWAPFILVGQNRHIGD